VNCKLAIVRNAHKHLHHLHHQHQYGMLRRAVLRIIDIQTRLRGKESRRQTFLKARAMPRNAQSVRHNKRLQFRSVIANFERLQPTTRQLTYQSTRSPSVQSLKMGRLHSNGKGISASAIPYSRNPPAWLKTTPEQVVEQIQKLAKKGATPSQ
jgi:hypothetical protein